MTEKDTDRSCQYSLTGILRYEWIFGKNFLAPGEPETSEALRRHLDDRPGQRILDIGSGLGGPAFLLARGSQASVTGVDCTEDIHQISLERLESEGLSSRVEFLLGDITRMSWPEGRFDAVWSRDTLLHIPDKKNLFKLFHQWLVSGGQVLFTDYARCPETGSAEFESYVQNSAYSLHDLATYAGFLEQAGFTDVRREDHTRRFIHILKNDLDNLQNHREVFCRHFTPEDCDYLQSRWELKLRAAENGYLRWGWFFARKK